MSTHVPTFEKVARVSVLSAAATVERLETCAGEIVQASSSVSLDHNVPVAWHDERRLSPPHNRAS
jgi:hypothetical protein